MTGPADITPQVHIGRPDLKDETLARRVATTHRCARCGHVSRQPWTKNPDEAGEALRDAARAHAEECGDER